MKRVKYPRLFSIVLAGMAASFLGACQSSRSQFTEESQATMVLDTKPGTSGQNGLAVEGLGRPEGIGRFGGHYYYIRNGSAVRLYQRQRFAQGYSYEGRGRIVSASGSIVPLQPGEMVTFAGERIPVPPAISYP